MSWQAGFCIAAWHPAINSGIKGVPVADHTRIMAVNRRWLKRRPTEARFVNP
ncbi:MAG TPA: hypothetical protein VF135_12040 [Terriglobales bacterium]